MNAPSPLFLLAIDHRRSFERLFGIDGPVDAAAHARLAAAKVATVEALATVVAERPELDGAGVLLDDDYGTAAIESARRARLVVAVAFERSGQAVLEFEHEDWEARLAALTGRPGVRAGLAKLLVRHRADGDAAARTVQLERLRRFSDACAAAGLEFMLELLTPFDDAELAGHDVEELENVVRPRLITDAIAEIQAAGVEAAVWKVEGVSDPAGCAAIVAAAQAGGRDNIGVVVLGAGAEPETVAGWLRAAAAGGYRGFAVGRSIWADPLRALDAGDTDAATAKRQIAASYLDMVETFAHAVPA
ncbi:MAG: 2-deoxy-5-keto-D-gluconate 6-phosphate aldolase domain-containing protein [Acidimicrobiales bacterium]